MWRFVYLVGILGVDLRWHYEQGNVFKDQGSAGYAAPSGSKPLKISKDFIPSQLCAFPLQYLMHQGFITAHPWTQTWYLLRAFCTEPTHFRTTLFYGMYIWEKDKYLRFLYLATTPRPFPIIKEIFALNLQKPCNVLTINVPLFKKLRDNLGVKKVEAPQNVPRNGS